METIYGYKYESFSIGVSELEIELLLVIMQTLKEESKHNTIETSTTIYHKMKILKKQDCKYDKRLQIFNKNNFNNLEINLIDQTLKDKFISNNIRIID
jgi:exonuclease I